MSNLEISLYSSVNARLKLPENQRFEIAMTVQPARSFECPRCSSPAGLHRRSLGGKRGPGDSPLSRPQPPEAVAEGQALCARHAPWIGGAGPLRSKLEAPASRRQLHAGWGVARQSGLAP